MANTTMAANTGITRNGFRAYSASHRGAPLRTLRSAYARRRAAVCKALGLTARAFDVRAKAAAEALVGFPGTYADRVAAYSYVANRMAAAVEAAPVAAPAPAPVALVSSAANDNAVPASDVTARWSVTVINGEEGCMYSAGVRGTYEEACAAVSGMTRAAVGWRVIGPSPTCPEAMRLAAAGMRVRTAVN